MQLCLTPHQPIAHRVCTSVLSLLKISCVYSWLQFRADFVLMNLCYCSSLIQKYAYTCSVSYRGWGVLGFPIPSSSIPLIIYRLIWITLPPQWCQVSLLGIWTLWFCMKHCKHVPAGQLQANVYRVCSLCTNSWWISNCVVMENLCIACFMLMCCTSMYYTP